MAGSRRIVVEFLGQDKNLSRTATEVDHKTSRLGETFKKVGKYAALGLGAGLVIAGRAMVGMVKNAAEDQASQRKLAVALKNTAKATDAQVASVEDWISRVGVATGVTDDEMRPAFQRLVQATGNIAAAQRLMRLSLDASAGSGKSLEAVTTALSKAQNGNMGALSRLGIKIKDTKGEALSFTEVTKQMADTFEGQAAAKANSLDGKMQRLKLVFDETKETIGAKLIPVVEDVATWFLKLVKQMESGKGAGGALKDTFTGIGNVIRPIANFIGHQFVPFIKDLAQRFKDAMGGTKGFHKAMSDAKPGIDILKRVLGLLWEGLKWAARTIIPQVARQFRLMAKVIGILGKAATWLWNKAFQPALRLIVKGIGGLMVLFGKMLVKLSKVPGFGWAKKAGENMQEAGHKAQTMGDKIKKIPDSKKVKVSTPGADKAIAKLDTLRRRAEALANVAFTVATGIAPNGGHRATGGSVYAGKSYTVGETGRETFVPTSNGRIVPSRRADGGRNTTIVVNIHGVTDKKGAAREVRAALLELKRSNGGAALGLA